MVYDACVVSERSYVVHRNSWVVRCSRIEIENVDQLDVVGEEALFDSVIGSRIFPEKFMNFAVIHILIEALLQVCIGVFSEVSKHRSVLHENRFFIHGIFRDMNCVNIFKPILYDDPIHVYVCLFESDNLISW